MAATTIIATEVDVEIVEGSWQDKIVKSNKLLARGTQATSKAGTLLWTGAQEGILDWLEVRAETDVNGEGLYNEIVGLLGKPRRGDAHKIKMVALAVKDHGLVLSQWEALSKAWKEAKRLIVDVEQDKKDDEAADKAIEALADSAPSSTKTVDGAALLLLSKGVDGAIVAVLDAISEGAKKVGVDPMEAYRSFLRSTSQEIAGRAPKPEPKAVSTAPKAGATKVKAGSTKAAPVVKAGKAKPKPNPKSDRKPVEAEVEADGADEEVEADLPDVAVEDVTPEDAQVEDAQVEEVEADQVEEAPVKAAPIKAKPITRAKPVVRR